MVKQMEIEVEDSVPVSRHLAIRFHRANAMISAVEKWDGLNKADILDELGINERQFQKAKQFILHNQEKFGVAWWCDDDHIYRVSRKGEFGQATDRQSQHRNFNRRMKGIHTSLRGVVSGLKMAHKLTNNQKTKRVVGRLIRHAEYLRDEVADAMETAS